MRQSLFRRSEILLVESEHYYEILFLLIQTPNIGYLDCSVCCEVHLLNTVLRCTFYYCYYYISFVTIVLFNPPHTLKSFSYFTDQDYCRKNILNKKLNY